MASPGADERRLDQWLAPRVGPTPAAGIIALLAALFLAAAAWGPIRRWRRRARIAADEARMEPKPVVY